MKRDLICIGCPQGCRLTVTDESGEIKVSGNSCPRGAEYGFNELTAPKRVITSTVKLADSPHSRLPVKTNKAVPKELIFDCMAEINKISVTSPVKLGDVVLKNILGSGADVVATRSM